MTIPEIEEAGVSAGRVSVERLREILAGCEGGTPGPWRVPRKTPFVLRDPGPFPGDAYGSVQIGECGNWRDKDLVPFNMDRWMADARHIARLDPETVASIVTELLALRTQESSNDQ
jgi:hypothetical protein